MKRGGSGTGPAWGDTGVGAAVLALTGVVGWQTTLLPFQAFAEATPANAVPILNLLPVEHPVPAVGVLPAGVVELDRERVYRVGAGVPVDCRVALGVLARPEVEELRGDLHEAFGKGVDNFAYSGKVMRDTHALFREKLKLDYKMVATKDADEIEAPPADKTSGT